MLLEYTGEKYEEVTYKLGGPPDYDSSSWHSVKHSVGLDFPNV